MMGRPRHLEYVFTSKATYFGGTWDWNNTPGITILILIFGMLTMKQVMDIQVHS